jgi:hypothetical protein
MVLLLLLLLSYLLQLSCHSVAVVLTLIQIKQIRINVHKIITIRKRIKIHKYCVARCKDAFPLSFVIEFCLHRRFLTFTQRAPSFSGLLTCKLVAEPCRKWEHLWRDEIVQCDVPGQQGRSAGWGSNCPPFWNVEVRGRWTWTSAIVRCSGSRTWNREHRHVSRAAVLGRVKSGLLVWTGRAAFVGT